MCAPRGCGSVATPVTGHARSHDGSRLVGDTVRIAPTDVVILRDYSGSPEDLQRLADELHEATGVRLVVNLARGESLESLDEDAMRKRGWVRA